jgi:O-antigen/teichoic acid export membrane protein
VGEDIRKSKLSSVISRLTAMSTALSRVSSFRSTSLGVSDQAIVGATGFAASVIIGRFGSREELGIYYLMLSALIFARGIQESTTSMPYTVYWSRIAQERRAVYAGSCLSHQIVLAALTSLALLCFTIFATLGIAPHELVSTAAVLIAFVPALLLKEYLRRLSFAHMRMASALQLDVTVAFVQVAGLLVFAMAGMLTAPSAYVIIGLACIVSCVAWFARDHIPFRFVWGEVGEDWKWNWRIGKWAVAGRVACLIVPTVIPWVLGYFHGLGETGLLGAGFALVGAGNILVIGVINVLTPRAVEALAQGGQGALWVLLRNTSVGLVVMLSGFLLFSVLVGEFVAVLIFGPEFGGVGVVMATLALALLINSLAMTGAAGLYALEQTRANFIVDVIAALLALCAAMFLIVPLGALGAAIASVVAAAVAATGNCLVLIRLIRSSSVTAL